MASKPGVLSHFPWESMGNYKYALFLPFMAVVATGVDDGDNWCWHMCALAAARYALAQGFMTASRVHAISGQSRIQKRGIGFEQMDREENWDDFIILQTLVMTLVHLVLPGFHSFPTMDLGGLGTCLLLHAGPTELVYYWFHRALHHHSLFAQYHSHHHKSFVTEPVSGSCHPFLEHVGYTANFAIPMLGTWLLGGCSVAMFYLYTCGFDVLNMIGHCNWEFIPVRAYRAVPLLKYLVYTPSYHSLHHSRVHTNFCLFMPVYDYMFGTLLRDKDEGSMRWTSDRLQETSLARTKAEVTPECVFLAHGTDLLSVFHLPMFLRGFAKDPYTCHWALWPLWPLAALGAAVLWKFGRVFVSHDERCGGKQVQTWVVPRFGFQYFLGRKEEARINALIERAVRDADAAGVKVLGLGALNKAEHLNGGGVIFPEAVGPQLKTRVVHGNTLTAGCLLAELDLTLEEPASGDAGAAARNREVFVTGATSKLGRATALYLCAKGVKVVMLTSSEERFLAIQREASPEARHLLVRAATHAEGAGIATWVVAKQCGEEDQRCAPPGCHFHQVVVPPIHPYRADCTYGELAAMQLPPSSADTKACELFMPRRTVFACHAGALTHCLMGWQHHEVGAIDVANIDVCMGAALSLGFLPATKGWPEASRRAFQARVDEAARKQAVGAAEKSRPVSEDELAITSDEAASDESSVEDGGEPVEPLNPARRHSRPPRSAAAAPAASHSSDEKRALLAPLLAFEVVAGPKDAACPDMALTPPGTTPAGLKRDLSPTAARVLVDDTKRQK